MFKFYLNNIQVQDALNWFDFTETIERDEAIKGLLPKYDVKLNFDADGYNYLYSQLKTNGYCNLVELKVDYKCGGGYETILNGFIFISDCKFNLNRCTVECSVIDNNYGAKIHNNKTIKAYLNVGRSKNDVAITACDYDNIKMFTPSTGAISTGTRKMYLISDAFRFLIDFMSDGTIGFESDYLTTVTDPYYGIEGLRIATGHEIRTGLNSEHPFISFQTLFQEVDKKYPIGFTVVIRNGIPTIKIEEASYFYNASNSITVNGIDNLQQSFNNELLYSSIKLGDPALETDASHSFEQIRFFNFMPEEYHLQGECNIDKVLDLTGIFIADTNIIEGLWATDTTNESYDKDIVFIQTYGGTHATSTADPLTQLLPLYYNDNLKNNKVAERLSLQNNIALYLGNNDDLFLASKTILQNFISGVSTTAIVVGDFVSSYVPFEDDSTPPNFDTNNRYNTTTSVYTSPANGVYSFEVFLKSQTFFTSDAYIGITIEAINTIEVYDASNVRQTFYEPADETFTFFINSGTTINSSYTYTMGNIYLPSSYYIKVKTYFYYTPTGVFAPGDYYELQIDVFPTSTFSCISSVNGGGVYDKFLPSDYFVSKFEFEKSLSSTDYSTLKLDLSKSIIINNGSGDKEAWIRKSIRKLATGETTWELISNLDNS